MSEIIRGGGIESPASNRLRDWVRLVPDRDVRRYAYGIWRNHVNHKVEQAALDRGTTVEDSFDAWEKTLLRGNDARKEIERRIALVKEHFDSWLSKAFQGGIMRNDVAYAALFGSSYLLPRTSETSDIDIGVMLKERIPVTDYF